MTVWCAVDPGLRGGIAFINDEGECAAAPMPVIDKQLDYQEVIRIFKFYQPDYTTVELVHAVAGGSRKSAFQFGYMYGSILSMAHNFSAHVSLVRPKVWQQEIYGKVTSDKTMGEKFCIENYPDTPIILPRCRKFHDGITDAICIAQYCRNHNQRNNDEELLGNPASI